MLIPLVAFLPNSYARTIALARTHWRGRVGEDAASAPLGCVSESGAESSDTRPWASILVRVSWVARRTLATCSAVLKLDILSPSIACNSCKIWSQP